MQANDFGLGVYSNASLYASDLVQENSNYV